MGTGRGGLRSQALLLILLAGCGSSRRAVTSLVDGTADGPVPADGATGETGLRADSVARPDATSRRTDASLADGSLPVCACPECYYFDSTCHGVYCEADAQGLETTQHCVIPALTGKSTDVVECIGVGTAPATWSVESTCGAACGGARCSTARLWIAFDAATAGVCGTGGTATLDQYWSCVLGRSNFDTLAAAYGFGTSLSFGGLATLATPCMVTLLGNDDATAQCIEDQTGWPIGPGDVILYLPSTSLCGAGGGVGGWNNQNASVHHGTAVYPIEYGISVCNTSCRDEQYIGFHEVYEALTNGNSADCCDGQDGCTPPIPGGIYTSSACGPTLYLQEVSPFGMPAAASCAMLTFH